MDKVSPQVTVVIATHNGWKHTQSCMMALMRVTYDGLGIILVDDGSEDGTGALVAEQFPEVRVLNGDGSLWWAGSMNLGIREALARGADYVLALNNDVLVSPGCVNALVNCAQQHPKSVVGSLIYRADHREVIWCAGGDLRWPWPGEFMIGMGEADQGQYEGVRSVRWTPGMGTLMSREILLALRCYDAKNMPQYIADNDFTLRAGRAGYSVLVTSASKLYNHVENTGGISRSCDHLSWKEAFAIFTSFRSPEYLRARLVFLLRHCPKRWLIAALLIRYCRLVGYAVKRVFRSMRISRVRNSPKNGLW